MTCRVFTPFPNFDICVNSQVKKRRTYLMSIHPGQSFHINGHIVNVFEHQTFSGEIRVEDGVIVSIEEKPVETDQWIVPGFIDAHVHIESSMLVPSEFARVAVTHGTIAAVCYPHEIANVMGKPGIEFMLKNAEQSPFKFYFGAPSCVPATPFETSGATLTVDDIEELFTRYNLRFLSEMMNVPGVLSRQPEVMDKLKLARKYGRPVDGHSPGLMGKEAANYIAAGITTDHECVTLNEARYKISHGMNVQIREGSAARNFDDLYPLIEEFSDQCMLCSDDKHPDDLVQGHINRLVHRGLQANVDLYNLLEVACVTPVRHYGLDVGLLRVGDPADFLVIDDLNRFNILQTYIDGQLVANHGKPAQTRISVTPENNFHCQPKTEADFVVPAEGDTLKTIDVIPGQLITGSSNVRPKVAKGNVVPDVERDILKLSVVNRYRDAEPALAFVREFGLKSGAIASSVAHDSHNIVAVGTNDRDLCQVVNRIIAERGGIAIVNGEEEDCLPLPVAGIMSDGDGWHVAKRYAALDRKAKGLGSTLPAPFMTLSFLALLVIPKLKLSDQGLFDGSQFQFTSLFG